MACATVTLLLFGWCQDEATLGGENPQSYSYVDDHPSTTAASGHSYIAIISSQLLAAFTGCTARGGVSDTSLMLTAILGGLSGVVGEALPLGVDDNLSMPLVSGAIFLALQRHIDL